MKVGVGMKNQAMSFELVERQIHVHDPGRKVPKPIWHGCMGILPLNELELNERNSSFCKFSLIHTSTLPKSLFFASCKIVKSIQFFNDKGTSPDRLLSAKFKAARLCPYFQQFGISPDKLFEDRSK